jgi:hypothetical protein
VLIWFREGEDIVLLGTGFGVSRATAELTLPAVGRGIGRMSG